jgi:hypothetical protein
MIGLTMRVQRTEAFRDSEHACETIAAIARELAAGSLAGRIWTRFRGAVMPMDLDAIQLLLTEIRPVRIPGPGQATHVIPINRLPTGPGEVGSICVTVRRAPEPSSNPVTGAGLRLVLRVSDTSFKSDADALVRLLGECFDAALADSGVIGPRGWVKELGTGWATATRRAGRDWLPAGSSIVPCRTGSITIAHREDPVSTSATARDAIARVREALNGSPVLTPAPAPRAAPVVTPPVVARPVMTPPPLLQPATDLSRTLSAPSLPVPDRGPTNPLPFGGTPSAEFVASFAEPASTTPHPAVGETLPLGASLLASLRPTLPFEHSAPRPGAVVGKRNEVAETLPLGANVLSAILPTLPFNQPARASGIAVPLPDLTLDAYASLCAELSVFPANAADILRKYGVADDRVKRGLDQRWQDLLTTAPPLRDEWQRKTTAFCDWLRRGGR